MPSLAGVIDEADSLTAGSRRLWVSITSALLDAGKVLISLLQDLALQLSTTGGSLPKKESYKFS